MCARARSGAQTRLVASDFVRRLVLLLSAVVAVDTMFYTALAPLLPHFATRYALGKGGAGVLAAMYAAGVLGASVPGGMAASRLGPKRAALLGVALTAVASLARASASASPGTSGRSARRAWRRESAARSPGRVRSPGSWPRRLRSGEGR